MKHGIAPKNAVEIESLQAYFNFLEKITKTFTYDLSSQFVREPKITFRDPNGVATQSLRSTVLANRLPSLNIALHTSTTEVA